ncbi:hypothetical protein F7725_027325 [Dissostichus mawsoni]|uniref:Protein kinase domain-containing protein n=1 Tax=Dissostichus mawsoni TaxID=36200 RepID=A0A7J5XDV0_DISMA|nr:hypothetical protein F7725_027325 [Dissostichus mawsoni]
MTRMIVDVAPGVGLVLFSGLISSVGPLESQEREVELGKRRKGTFGVVKRVVHRRTGEVFAAKFLPVRSSTRTRGFQERDLLSRLAHPRVACLLDFFCTRRTLVLITEMFSLTSSKSWKESPDNILMVYPPRDEIKICDFGFCQEIDASRHQYSLFGTPEFVAPEVVHRNQSLWPRISDGPGHPAAGGGGDAELGRPDVTHRSPEAQSFLHMLLQPDPELIPELLDAPLRETAVTVPREPQEHSSSSPSSGSSSEYDEADSWDCFQHYSPTEEEEEEEETEEEYDPFPEREQIPESYPKLHLDEEEEMTLGEEEEEEEEEDVELLGRRSVLERSVSRQSVASSDVSSQHTPQRERRFSKDSSQSLYLSDGEEGSGSDGGRIPRGSVIRSTFYSTSHQLSPMSARHMTLRDKFQAKKQERGRKPLRRSLSGRLNEPLIEYVEDDPETNRGQRRGSVQPTIKKSCSFDSGVSLPHANAPPHRRSRSLDEYSRRSPSSPKPDEEEEGSQSLKEDLEGDLTDDEATGRNLLAIPSPQRPPRRRGSIAPVQSGSSVPLSFVAGNRRRLDPDQVPRETFAGSQGSLAESSLLEHGGSESSSRLGSYEELSHGLMRGGRCRSGESEGYDDQGEPLIPPSPSSFQEVKPRSSFPQAPPRNRTRSNPNLCGQIPASPSPSLSSLQAPERPPRSRDKKESGGLQRHASDTALELRPPTGKSPKLGPIVKGSAPTPPERKRSSGLESPKKRASKLLPSFKIPAFKKSKDLLVRPNKAEVFQLDGGGVLLGWKPVQTSDPVTYCVQAEWTVLSEEVTESCLVVKDLPRGASYVFRTETLGSKVTGSERQTTHKNYNFLSEINRGRFSVLSLCRDVETSQVFVAKVTPYQAEQRLLVLREYQLLRRLHHPTCCSCTPPSSPPKPWCWCRSSAPARSCSTAWLPETQVVELLLQILSAVDYLHSRRVVHLDLKSDNMLVDDCNHLKVVDLGSALSFTPGQPLTLLRSWRVRESDLKLTSGLWEFCPSSYHAWEQDRNIRKGKIQFGRCYPGLLLNTNLHVNVLNSVILSRRSSIFKTLAARRHVTLRHSLSSMSMRAASRRFCKLSSVSVCLSRRRFS